MISTSLRNFSSISCPYAVLGLKRGASKDEVKRAYYQAAKSYHPDLNPSNTVNLI